MKTNDVYTITGVNKKGEKVFGFQPIGKMKIEDKTLEEMKKEYEKEINTLKNEVRELRKYMLELLKSYAKEE